MNLPDELHRMTVEALTAVQADPMYRLAPNRRLAIYHFLGRSGEPPDPVRKRARGWLGYLTARRVLPIWHELRPVWVDSNEHLSESNQLPDRLIAVARNMLRGTFDLQRAWQECNDLWFMMQNMGAGGLNRRHELPNRAYYARDASFKALHEVLCIEFLERATELEWTSDEHLKDWERDSAACGVLAEAGGSDAGLLDKKKRLQFWQWWLSEAIPSAWVYAQDALPQPVLSS